MNAKRIEERLDNLEIRQRLLTDSLLGIKKFAELALPSGFTAKEIEKIEMLFRWATEVHNFSRGKFILKFNKELPRRKDSITAIAKAYRADNRFPFACKHILSKR